MSEACAKLMTSRMKGRKWLWQAKITLIFMEIKSFVCTLLIWIFRCWSRQKFESIVRFIVCTIRSVYLQTIFAQYKAFFAHFCNYSSFFYTQKVLWFPSLTFYLAPRMVHFWSCTDCVAHCFAIKTIYWSLNSLSN